MFGFRRRAPKTPSSEFEALTLEYMDALYGAALRLTRSPKDAEDLVQDIFVRILKYRTTFRDDGSFETWLFRIARNARADYFRRRAPVEPLDGEAHDRPEPGPGPALRLQADRDRARLKRALMLLPEEKRELLVLARYRDMKYDQIADILGIEVGAVKVRVHRAVRELRQVFLQLRDENLTCDVKTSRRIFQII